MKRLTFNSLILGLMVGISLLRIAVAPDPKSAYYNIIDKEKILQRTSSPKIIFIGGSNLLFSHNSLALQKELGRPVINMGLNGGLGLRFMIEEIKPYTGPSDIIIVAPEYVQFFETFVNGDHNLWEFLCSHPQKFKLIRSFRQKMVLVEQIPEFISRKFRRIVLLSFANNSPGVYYSGKFDPAGDLLNIDGAPSPALTRAPLFADKVGPRSFNPEAIDVLNGLNAFASQKQARVFFIFPPIPDHHYQKNRDLIEYVHSLLAQRLHFPILSSAQENIYPITDFFDTVYHLNNQGKNKRTSTLLAIVKRIIILH